MHRSSLGAVLTSLALVASSSATDLPQREEQAMQQAVERVAPCVVRIETVGGLEQVGKFLVGTGPTTGLAVSADGYIISSAFNFVQKPASILVSLSDGTRAPAKLIATDHNRMLVLLKIEASSPLPMPEFVPENEMQVGQWAIAVGRTFEGDAPNVSIGIVSALRRIWGKALQTDAKISPANYGGPLVDIRGRVLGVLVPMAPQGSGVMAGMEWYDSGIGFAVPLEHIFKTLPRLQEGRDLHPGMMGVSFKAGDQFADAAVIATCRPNSPAYKAELKPGDTIVEIDGEPIVRQSQVKERITPHYAGDSVQLVVLRDGQRLERELTLVQTIEPYERPFLGILPLRDAAETAGVAVRFVYPDSPAAEAGLQADDVIRKVDNADVADRIALAQWISAAQPGQEISVELERAGKPLTLTLKLGKQPENVPAELPSARREPAQGDAAGAGKSEINVAEYANDCLLYVPETYRAESPHGVVMWLSADGAYDADALVARWKPWCNRDGLIFVAPQTLEPASAQDRRRWNPAADTAYLAKLLDQVRQDYNIDPTRVAVQGYQGGGAMAFVLAFQEREWIRGVVAVDAPLAGKPPEHEPVYPLAIYLARSTSTPNAKAIAAGVKRLEELKYPLIAKETGMEPHDLTDDEQAEVLRFIDSLDRI